MVRFQRPIELGNGARVGIVGGGPAGTLTAFFLLDVARNIGIDLRVEIFESRQFTCTGPAGCNMCGGVISESLLQMMAADGIHLPEEVVIDTIDSYMLHTDVGSVSIQAPVTEKRIASIYRGAGPHGAESQAPLPWRSFDEFLLNLAVQSGAYHIAERVTGIEWSDGRPLLITRGGERRDYDFLVGAVGINGTSVSLFEKMGRGYQPPRSVRAFIGEFYVGEKMVQRVLGHSMHVFLLELPGLKFAAMTPKGHYATFIILGDNIDKEMVQRVLAHPAVRQCLPPHWEIPVLPCQCQPRIYLGMPQRFFGHRFAMVGDCGVSRLYKDGIGAAYRTAKALAMTAVTHGVTAADLRKHYLPTCRALERDNKLGHLVFYLDELLGKSSLFRMGLLQTVQQEQEQYPVATERRLSGALWDIFTGSASYRDIVLRASHPTVLWHMIKNGWSSIGRH
ncbi:MAG: hypothetical protein HQL58_06165 [Magnetococcales bacterium]|nr:hypothetical protein [Magnetococcales bacterium]